MNKNELQFCLKYGVSPFRDEMVRQEVARRLARFDWVTEPEALLRSHLFSAGVAAWEKCELEYLDSRGPFATWVRKEVRRAVAKADGAYDRAELAFIKRLHRSRRR